MRIMPRNFNMIPPAEIARRVHSARIGRGLTLQELGAACEVHHSQVSRIERGKVIRVSKSVRKICTYLQISLLDSAPSPAPELITRVECLIRKSAASARAIEGLVAALEELAGG